MPFEAADLKSLQGKHNYIELTSNEVMQEMQSYTVQDPIAQDTRARAIGMHQGSSLALKARVVEQDDEHDHTEAVILTPNEIKSTHRDFVALVARSFWKNPAKAKVQVDKKHKASSFVEGNPKMKTCFNCRNQFHYVAECPYENREDHGGKLIYKSAAKSPIKKPYFKKNFPNKKSPSRMVLVTREEYISGDEDSDDE